MFGGFEKIIGAQLETVSRDMQRAAEELRVTELEATAGGGAVRVRVTGLGEIIDVKIDPHVVASGDTELVEDLVCAGVREAMRKSSELRREKIAGALPFGGMGMDLPDLI